MKLSVIVCTRNRAHQILPCLDSIAASLAHAAPVEAEIVVVDNGSTDDTSVQVEKWALSSAFPVNLEFEGKQGASYARNCGLRTAQGDLIIWTDDDCRLDINHIRTALRYDAADKELVLRGGRVELGDSTDLPISIKTDKTLQRWHINKFPQKNPELSNAFIGANMMMRRALVDKLGFFDERFGPGSSLPGGEEVDYAYRAYLAGILIEYAPDLVIFHFHGRKTKQIGNACIRNYLIAAGGLYAKYLFKHIDFCHPVYWNLKNGILETVLGWEYSSEKIGFRAKKVFGYNMIGAMRFYVATAKRMPQKIKAR